MNFRGLTDAAGPKWSPKVNITGIVIGLGHMCAAEVWTGQMAHGPDLEIKLFKWAGPDFRENNTQNAHMEQVICAINVTFT